MSDLKLIYGKNVRRLRELKGYDQKEFAKKMKVAPAQQNAIETGRLGFTSKSLVTYANALGVDPWQLLAPIEKKSQLEAATTHRDSDIVKILQLLPQASQGDLESILSLLSRSPTVKGRRGQEA